MIEPQCRILEVRGGGRGEGGEGGGGRGGECRILEVREREGGTSVYWR